ncbi:MAG: DUF5622 domain-containing protein [Desulfurococcaceae archaeon]|uniref:Cren protein n=1 Tax=Staphylothermus marinus TaxID=2280 RepID=A0A7C4D723_STAMA
MVLKHGKYIYVERKDGWFVKIRVLGVRFKKESRQGVDINDPNRYIVIPFKTKKPPLNATIVREEDIPQIVRERVYSI